MPRSLDPNETSSEVKGWKIAYARVSTRDQNLDRQISLLEEEGVNKIFKERASGSSRHRPELESALSCLREGDQLIVTSMDRLARSLVDLHQLVDELTSRDVSVKFLKEGQIYSKNATPLAKLMLGLLGSVAEFERAIIRERQAEGIARAKQRGVYKGRSKTLTSEEEMRVRALIDDGVPKAKVARDFGISRTTLYRYLRSSAGR